MTNSLVMKKIFFLSTMMLVMIMVAMLPQNVKAQVSVWDGTYTPWTNGTGTEADPFLIENAQQLAYLANRVNNGLDAAGGHVSNHSLHYKLMIDVNLNGSESFQWTPIGYWISNTNYYSFGGHFDGNNHTVSGLYINSSADRVGFFGYTDGATIKNLSINGDTVATTGQSAGGIVGYANETNFLSCFNTSNVSFNSSSYSSSSSYSGGIVGQSSGATSITNCYNTGNVSSSFSNSYSGGIVGQNSGTTTITNCYNTGNVSSSNDYSGGNSCYSGGIVGKIGGTATITNCYNTGNISSYCYSGYSYSGGIVGNGSGQINNCYYRDNCGGNNNYGGLPMSSAVMQTQEFLDILNNGTCAYEMDVVPSINQGYPILTMVVLSANTLNATNITQTHSTLKGTISVENDNILSAGFMYKASNATNYSFVSCNNVSDTIAYTLSGLTPSTSYSYRTYLVTAGCDTTFGTDKSFSTLAVSVTTNNPTSVTQSHATMNGTLSMGDVTVTSQGFEYMQSEGDWIQVTVPYNNNISHTLTNLTPNSQYSYRAFATANECGTIYGQTRTFSTLSTSATTNNATNITQTQATLNGSFTIGDANISAQGFEYKKTTDTAYQIVNVSGEGNITETITGLTPNTQYTYRTFCTAVGCETVYGNYRNFTTQAVYVTTNPATDLTESSATLNGTMSMGDATVTNQGFEYRAVGDANFATVSATGSTDNFSAPLYGLTVNTQYEYRAFVNIAESTEPYYGNIQTFEVSWLNADTILIYDADMLQWVSDRCNTGTTFEGKYIKLMNNIVLPLNQPNNMTSIGVYPNYPFKGTFDGNGMTITNLYIDQPNTPYQGFFGYTLNANLYQVGLVNITASGRNYTGGMVAYADNTYMRDCYVNGGSLFALSYCGGLVGYQSEGTNSIISGCYNTCTVSGTSYVGGLVGFSDYATVRNSYVAASVAAQGTAVGAIIGGANEVLMYNCYFSTSITGQSDAIGEHNFRDGEGLSNEEMQSTQFVATLNQGLVTPVWKSDYAVPINNGFPILIWQYSDAEACEAPENLSYTISGNSATLTWDGGDNASYFTIEYGMSGDDVHTENTGNHQLVIHDLQNGNYFWRVKSVCSFGESNFVNGSTIETGINNHDLNASLNVYPNPTTDIVNVELTINNGQSGDVAIQVYDMYGKLLDVVNVGNTDAMNRVPTDHSMDSYGVANTHGLSAQTTQIDLSRYANGVYFIKAVSEGNVLAVRKVVKNR